MSICDGLGLESLVGDKISRDGLPTLATVQAYQYLVRDRTEDFYLPQPMQKSGCIEPYSTIYFTSSIIRCRLRLLLVLARKRLVHSQHEGLLQWPFSTRIFVQTVHRSPRTELCDLRNASYHAALSGVH